MSLPSSRNTSYSASSPIKSADLNDVQDCIVAGKHGIKYLSIPAALARWDSGWAFAGSGNRVESSGSASLYLPVPAFVGDTLGDLVVYYYGNSAADIDNIDLYSVAPLPSGTATSRNTSGSWSISAPTSTPAAAVIGIDNYTLLSGENAFIRVVVNAAGIRILGAMVGVIHL